MQLKPQDFLVALKLVAWGEQCWTYARLAQELGMSVSEAPACIKRGLRAGLLVRNIGGLEGPAADGGQDSNLIHRVARRTRARIGAMNEEVLDNPARHHSKQLADFALYGAKCAFVADKEPMTIGVPTSHSAPAFAGVFAPGSDDFVWPHPNGTVRGIGVEPLHPSVPFAAMQDAKLYEMLALFDALRVGRARERGMAHKRLPLLIYPDGPKPVERPLQG